MCLERKTKLTKRRAEKDYCCCWESIVPALVHTSMCVLR